MINILALIYNERGMPGREIALCFWREIFFIEACNDKE
jgi:hypothetical protein